MPINLKNLNSIVEEISTINNCSLMIVTKNRDVEDINTLIKKKCYLFGENKVQEAKSKFSEITDKNVKLHLIGPLQTNKIKNALKIFDTIQTLDREKLIIEISKHLNSLKEYKTKDFYIQVNIGKEEQKAGVAPARTKTLYELALENNLKINGLMCIPPKDKNPNFYFNEMVNLRDSVNKNLKLSMGMSSDYQEAIQSNSNLIRIGSKIFQ